MVYDFGLMYQILDKYVTNNMEEIEHGFVPSLKWPDSYILEIHNEQFWIEIERNFDISFSERMKENIITVADLKEEIEN